MSDLYQSLSHTTWDNKYHVVFVPKQRRKVLFGNDRKAIGPLFHELARQKEYDARSVRTPAMKLPAGERLPIGRCSCFAPHEPARYLGKLDHCEAVANLSRARLLDTQRPIRKIRIVRG